MPDPAPLAPHRLGRYELYQRLAAGGMAEVWLARQDGPAGFEKDVVVKKILPKHAGDPNFVAMFLREARVAARLNHPNVVQIFELGEAGGTYYIVMEHIAGRNLRTVERRCKMTNRPMPLGFIAQTAAEACTGLHYAHELRDKEGAPLDLVHRDVSPDNVIVTFDGHAKLVDFGIAKATGLARITMTGIIKGKVAYMSPEHALGDPLDRRADVFSVGMMLYELIAGEHPYVGKTDAQILNAIMNEPLPPLSQRRPGLPKRLDDAVMRALAKKKEDRWSDARLLGRELEAFLRQDPWAPADSAALLTEVFESDGRSEDPLSRAQTLTLEGAAAANATQLVAAGAPTDPEQARGGARRFRFLAAGGLLLAGAATAVIIGGGGKWSSPPAEDLPAPHLVAPARSAPAPVPEPSKPAPAPALESPKPLEKGKLLVQVYPWAEVWIGKRSYGITPIEPIELPAGSYKVLLKNDELAVKRTVTAVVKPHQNNVLKAVLSAPE